MKKIKIAVIGINHDHGLLNLQVILSLSEFFELVGYAIPKDDKESGQKKICQELGLKEYTLDELFSIPDLEAVAVETYDLNLVKYAQMAADRGLHVFMDKPGSQESEDFERMLSTLKRKGKIFSIGYMYRFNEAVKELFSEVKAGKLGEIYSVEAQMNCDHSAVKREWLKDFKGGMTFYLGCHLVDLIYTFQGMPEEIIPYNGNTGLFGVTSKDFGFAVFKYKNGVSFLKTTACEPGGFERRQLVVCGSLGTVELKPLEWSEGGVFQTKRREFLKNDGEKQSEWWKSGENRAVVTKDRYQGMLIDFAQKIRLKGMSDDEYEGEARVHRMVLVASGIDCDYKGEIIL